MKKERSLNIELLRIFAMFFIVFGHLTCIIGDTNNLNWFNKFLLYVPFGFVPGVNCFVLISSYFLINAEFKAQRLVRTILETLFYTVILTIVCFFFFNKGDISIYDIIKSFYILGPTKYNYWFISKFIALLALQPFLSKLALALTKKQYKIFLAVLILINTELVGGFPFGGLYGGGFSLMWFICLFFTAGYLRLHYTETSHKKWLILLIVFVTIKACIQYYNLGNIISLSYNSLITYGMAISCFMFFKNLKISNSNKFIKFISPNILGVYLIHCHYDIYNLIINSLSQGEKDYKIIYLLFWSICIFLICTIIDKFRLYIFRILGITKLELNVSQWLQCQYNKFNN